MTLYENAYIYIEEEKSEVPWLKVFTKEPYKEFSDCPKEVKSAIWDAIEVIEKEMLNYFQPKKINIASFGNYLPHVHFHVMSRFENDSYFPEPMWGKKQREATLTLPSIQAFYTQITHQLSRQEQL